LAIDKAKSQSMPKDNIDRAIRRATGEGKEGETYEEVFYEGYAPNGVAVIIECVTENRNRTVSEVRHILSRTGGNMGEVGSVAWQFKRATVFSFDAEKYDFDKIFELAVEGGADDVTEDEGEIDVVATVETFKTLSDRFRAANMIPEEAGLRMLPNQEMELSVEDTLQVLRAIESIEELDDVQNVYSNLKISDEAMAAMESE
jgi:YebC/PmpR family DNA-binding regulatory protein